MEKKFWGMRAITQLPLRHAEKRAQTHDISAAVPRWQSLSLK
jgi:hypothetical protein